MDYKIDVSLSTNEVYTLTFDYTFDEGVEDQIIRLEIGDLTIETQDRRVVFKTTSSATCIKSNVRLGNVQLYEGKFEDYDQHGEYTKESYLKGRTLMDISKRLQPYHTSDDWNSRDRGYCDILEDGWRKMVAGTINYNHYKYKIPVKDVFISGNYYTIYACVRNNKCTTGAFYFNIGHSNQIKKSTGQSSYQAGENGNYLCLIQYNPDLSIDACSLTFNNATEGDNFEFLVMILEGDYYDEVKNGLIKPFKGIGCVKSPTITSIGNEHGFGKGGRL